jgi:hypothetical protein
MSCFMSLHYLAAAAVDTTTTSYASLNPALNAAAVLIGFIVLLFLVTRMNRDK